MKNKLFKHSKKIITKSELEKMFSTHSDEKLYLIVNELVSEEVLVPIKISLTNGNFTYPIYQKYKIIKPEVGSLDVRNEISKLHPKLQKNDYLIQNPKIFETHKDKLEKIDNYLFSNPDLNIHISRKERSFEIFGVEKVLDDKNFCSLLEKLGLGMQQLAYYDTPEYCFHDYILNRDSILTLLICENKDIWFNIRRMLFEYKASKLFDTVIDGVVYGNGNKISKKGALTEYSNFLGDLKVKYLYWGDIDRAGLNIYCSLKRGNPDLDISLFTRAYEEMLSLSKDKNIPNSDDFREKMEDYSEIYSCISETYRLQMTNSILDNKRIPQEIITYAYLKGNMR